MTEESFQKYLQDRFYDQVTWFDKKAVRYKKCYQRLTFSSIVLSAASPPLIAIFQETRVVPLVSTALVTVISGVLAAFSFQELWLKYRAMVSALRREKYYFDACIKEYLDATSDEQRRQVFAERVEDVLSDENLKWLTSKEKK